MFMAWRADVIHHSSHYIQYLGLLVLLETRYLGDASFQKKSAEGLTHTSNILLLQTSFHIKVVLFASSCHKLRIVRRPGLVSSKSDK
jgi:hypothetical protein